jgi:succinate dehydrogenase / fumarate reductase cytochrome b subunit
MSEASSSIIESCRCALPSICRKQIVGLTGLGLAVFVMIHMSGNMLMFVSARAYNEYSHALTSSPLIYAAELGLVAFFLFHAFYATYLTWKNYRARPEKYAMRASGEKRTPWVHRTLFAQGLILLFFVINHLIMFKYGPDYRVNYGNGEIRDLFKLVNETFAQPGFVVWYLVALVILGLHLSHGVSSAVQTFGIHHPRYQTAIKWFGRVYALVVSLGFISQPIYIWLFYKG